MHCPFSLPPPTPMERDDLGHASPCTLEVSARRGEWHSAPPLRFAEGRGCKHKTCSCDLRARGKDHRNGCHQKGESSSQHTELVEDVTVNQLHCVLFPLTCLYPHTSPFSVFDAKKEQRASLKPSGNTDARK